MNQSTKTHKTKKIRSPNDKYYTKSVLTQNEDMTYYHRIILEFDGASRNNPRGPAGCGFVLYEMNWNGSKGNFIDSESEYLQYNISNNQAEYQGLINGLTYVRDYLSCRGLYIRGDSEMVINQINGYYAVRSQNIIPYYNEAMDTLGDIDLEFYKCQHIARSQNWEADELANDAIDNNNYNYW